MGAVATLDGGNKEEEIMKLKNLYYYAFGPGLALIGTAVLLAFAAPTLAKEKRPVIERYQATAMSLDAGRASLMEIGIFGWNTAEERQAMIDAFNEGGNKGLYNYLDKQKEMAFASLPTTLGYQMRFAYQTEADGKRHIVLVTNRPISMGEVMTGSTSQEDNISLVVLELDTATGKGTGEMIVGAGFRINKKTGKLEIETLSQNPIKFTTVKQQKVKEKKK
jgi:hypothetical protein